MDIKSMLIKLAEDQADKMKEEAMGHIASDEFSNMLATKMNEKINIPFVKEEKEQIFFEEMMDVVTDLLEGVFKGKKMKTITTIFLVSILNSYQPQTIVADTNYVAMSEIKKKKKKGKKIKKKGKKKKKGFFSKFKGAK